MTEHEWAIERLRRDGLIVASDRERIIAALAAARAQGAAEAFEKAAKVWPCFFCNGLGYRGPYERDTPDGSEVVPRHKCETCGGMGRDEKQAVAIRALAERGEK